MKYSFIKDEEGLINIDEKLISGLIKIIVSISELDKGKVSSKELNNTINFSAKGENGTNYQTKSIEEFESFIGQKPIYFREIRLSGGIYDQNRVSFTITKRFLDKVALSYSIESDEQNMLLFQSKIEDVLESQRVDSLDYLLFAKKIIPTGLTLIFVLYAMYFSVDDLSNKTEEQLTGATLLTFGVVWGSSTIVFLIATYINHRLFQFLFPSKVINLGKGKKTWENAAKLRNNLFWVVGVGLIVTLLGSLITRYY